MGPDVIVFFEPNIDCDLGLFDANMFALACGYVQLFAC